MHLYLLGGTHRIQCILVRTFPKVIFGAIQMQDRKMQDWKITDFPEDNHMLAQRWPNKLRNVGPALADDFGPTKICS